MTRVILYPRVSSKHQAQGDSIEGQLLRLKQYCSEKGYEIVDVYTDAGKSASIKDEDDLDQVIKNGLFCNDFRIEKRPGFKRLLQEAPEKKFDGIVFFKWDRVFRDIAFADLSYRYFRRYGIALIPTDDSDDPLVSSIMQTLSKQEVEKMKARVRQSRLVRFERGEMVAKAPFGYRYNKNRKVMEIDKRKADIVKDIFLATERDIDYRIICKQHGINAQQYYNIIRNKVYIGIVSFEGKEKIGVHEPIVSVEIFNKVNNIKNE